ncbi:hypothetical protein, partial [Bacillus thuringiensis]|uniref:hypothetical protein n=2 Tax=Bacillus thuringiensis TaxID=1428 RepID=UPI001A8DB830
ARKLEDTNSLKRQSSCFKKWCPLSYFVRGMWEMKALKDQLREWKKQSTQVEKKQKRKRKENLSTRDIEDLMGIHGPRYERRRGALRQK